MEVDVAPSRRINYAEGTWFAVPLREGATPSVSSHVWTAMEVVGYFFGPHRDQLPTLDQVANLGPDRALRVMRFGGLGLIEEDWPVVGCTDHWDRRRWPVPAFGRFEEVSDRAWRVEYAEANLAAPKREVEISRREAAELARDVLSGAGAVELVLTELLRVA